MAELTNRQWILEARENDLNSLISGIQTLYNCRSADVDTEGDIWIADPMRGHWLNDDGIALVARAVQTGYI